MGSLGITELTSYLNYSLRKVRTVHQGKRCFNTSLPMKKMKVCQQILFLSLLSQTVRLNMVNSSILVKRALSLEITIRIGKTLGRRSQRGFNQLNRKSQQLPEPKEILSHFEIRNPGSSSRRAR